jgi:hypothetical protein
VSGSAALAPNVLMANILFRLAQFRAIAHITPLKKKGRLATAFRLRPVHLQRVPAWQKPRARKYKTLQAQSHLQASCASCSSDWQSHYRRGSVAGL